MKRNVFGEPTKRNVLWLLAQFLGLSNALRGIHNLSDSDTKSGATTNLLAPRRRSGWHHDLKPQNILCFRGSGSTSGWFQIADFGSGKVHTYRSGGSVNTRSPNGTPTYEPPEAAKEGATSRPYDLWSMGCVFLELMIWAVYGYSFVRSFAGARTGRRFPGSTTNIIVDDAFWYIDADDKIYRRSSVNDWLAKLGKDLTKQHFQHFKGVIDLIERMLDTNRLERISALDLWDTLSRICDQTKVDLEHVKSGSIPEQPDSATDAPQMTRLSTKAPDRRTPETIGTAAVQRPEGHAQRTPPWTGAEFLTASPLAMSSTRAHRRNSSISGNSDVSDVRMRERSVSNVSSTHVQDGSYGGRTPDASNTRPS